jgi:hypothetical protein
VRALQVYAPLFLDDEDPPDDVEIEAELTDAEVDDLGGGAQLVVPTGFELTFTGDSGSGSVVFEDDCVAVDIESTDEESAPIDNEVCVGEDEQLPDEIGDVEVPEELQDVAEAFLPLRFGVVTVERDGEHFVAPVRTAGELLLGLTGGLERDDLEEGGAVFALLSGELDDELEELFDEVFDAAFEDDAVFDDEFFEDEFEDVPCEGVGCGFEDDGFVERFPTGATGPNGELLPFDVVEGEVAQDGIATFTAIVDVDGDYFIGVQGQDGFDAVMTVTDEETGEVLAEDDDTIGRDPEVLLQGVLQDQVLTIDVRGFAGDPGSFLVYFEDAF